MVPLVIGSDSLTYIVTSFTKFSESQHVVMVCWRKDQELKTPYHKSLEADRHAQEPSSWCLGNLLGGV